jgi:hypothetical protein
MPIPFMRRFLERWRTKQPCGSVGADAGAAVPRPESWLMRRLRAALHHDYVIYFLLGFLAGPAILSLRHIWYQAVEALLLVPPRSHIAPIARFLSSYRGVALLVFPFLGYFGLLVRDRLARDRKERGYDRSKAYLKGALLFLFCFSALLALLLVLSLYGLLWFLIGLAMFASVIAALFSRGT